MIAWVLNELPPNESLLIRVRSASTEASPAAAAPFFASFQAGFLRAGFMNYRGEVPVSKIKFILTPSTSASMFKSPH